MEQSAPTVSVVIATFRRPHFLNQALESVYAQTFKDFEVIIADDGSGDEFTSQYKLGENTQLVCHSEPGRGSACTRNTGTGVARGRYVAYLDDDDVWLPEKLEKQVRVLEEHPEYGLTYCHHILVDEDLRHLEFQPAPRTDSGNCLNVMLRKNVIKSPSCVLVRRDVLDKCGLYDERLRRAEDWELFARIAGQFQFHADPAPLVLYRLHSSQKTTSSFTARRRGMVQVVETMQGWVQRDARNALPIVHRSLAFRLQQLSRCEAQDGRYGAAMQALRRSITLWPWSFRPYGRLLQVAWYLLRHHGRF